MSKYQLVCFWMLVSISFASLAALTLRRYLRVMDGRWRPYNHQMYRWRNSHWQYRKMSARELTDYWTKGW